MKTHKTVFRYYTIMEYEKEQEWLSRQHRQGWKLTAAAVCFYRFERCAPEDVVYQLDYNPEGRKHPEEYVQLFRDCGWEHVLDNVGYSYFRKPASQMQGREEIFCDEASRMEMFRRILYRRMLPLLILIVGAFLPLSLMELLDAASAADALAIGIPAGLVVALYIAVFAQCALQYIRLRKGR